MMNRIRENSATMAGRLAARQADVEIREAKRAHDARVKFYKTVGGAGASSFRGLVGGAAAMAGTALTVGGGFLIGDVVAKRMAAEKTAGLLVNAVTSGGKSPSGAMIYGRGVNANINGILGQASAASIATGMSKEELIGGSLEYSRKARGGDFKGAMENMEFFGKMAKVTGADINDIAGAAGTLQSQNQNLKAPEMQQMLLDVYAQGKAGSMSMVDVAKQIGVLGSTRSAYAGDAATNQRKLMALGQLAAPEGSTEEAGTFIKDLTLEAGKHRFSTRDSVGLQDMGVKFDKYGRMDSPEQMIDAVMKFNKGDITKIEKTFGARGKALFGALQPDYVAAGGGDAGIAAINKKMAGVTGATMSLGDLDAQHAQSMSEDGEKLHLTLMKIEDMFDAKLAPSLEKFANKLPEILPALQKLADKLPDIIDSVVKFGAWFADNPIKGVGAVVLGKISADMARAAIGEEFKRIIARIFAGQTVTGAAGGVASGAGGTGGVAAAGGSRLGAAAAPLGIAAGAILVGNQMIDNFVDSSAKGQKSARDLTYDVQMGRVSPQAAQKMVDEASRNAHSIIGAEKAQAAGWGAAVLGLTDSVTGRNDSASSKAVLEKQARDSEIASSQYLKDAIAKALVDAAKQAAPQMIASMKGDPNHPSRNSPMSSNGRGGSQ